MRIPEKLIVVSGKSILSKRFDVTEDELIEKLSGDELDQAIALLPTNEEKEWMDIFTSTMPELHRYRQKISVCLDVEVKEMAHDSITYEYNGKTFRAASPRNAITMMRALEDSESDGVLEMIKQGCVSIDGKILKDAEKSISIEDLMMLKNVVSKFFFRTSTVLQSMAAQSPRG